MNTRALRLVLLILFTVAARLWAADAPRPNVLFIYTDDQSLLSTWRAENL